MSETPCHDSRRTFCKVCIGGLTATSAGMVGYPVISFLGPPVQVGANKPLEMPLDKLISGQAEYLNLRGQQIIVLATAQGPRVFSAACPHLGCSVNWDASDSSFRCPCHGAVFSDSGEVVGGPVSNPLKQIPFEVKDEKIIVT